jgi:hypothetical protein
VVVVVVAVLEVSVFEVVVGVVVVHPPSYEAWVSSPHTEHCWSEVDVAATLSVGPNARCQLVRE